jgi:biotin carboxyl carrier protein
MTASAASPAASGASTWLDAVRRIISAVRTSDVAEFELRNGDFRVRVRRRIVVGSAPASVPSAAPDRMPEEAHQHRVLAPLTGIFFRAPSPSARPFVNEDDWVDADTVIGLLEAMKIFNEVTAEQPGRIVAFQAEDGQLVHTGDPLVILEPGERPVAESQAGL